MGELSRVLRRPKSTKGINAPFAPFAHLSMEWRKDATAPTMLLWLHTQHIPSLVMGKSTVAFVADFVIRMGSP